MLPLYAAWSDLDERMSPHTESENAEESVYEISLN
jgi:hypothetical protein